MALAEALEALRADPQLKPGFVEWRELPPVPAAYAELPPGFSPRLRGALERRGIERLYVHQAEALEAVLGRKHIVVVTPTASGKTLCYNLPVLATLLEEPDARALYIFPTKALAQDQMDELHGLITELKADIKTFTYDGDTPSEARRKVREAGHVVVTNPDMLHTGILPHHTKWVKLFENLRYIVIDELHQYRGVFGSHFANVLRRLARICRFYGSSPLFICSSATILNPGELAERLLQKPVHLIERSGAPRGRKIIAVYNPPVVNRELGIRQSSVNAARALGTKLLKERIQTIVFAPSRVRVELLLRYLREALKLRVGEEEKVEGYRGGYLPSERRAVERGLREGKIRCVVSTNALELGIDVGSLDASILTGYPGSLASAWQQMGRAGRRNGLSFSVIVASSSPLNQYLAANPEYLFETSPEAGLIDPDNFLVRVGHLKCAAFELPFEGDEDFGPDSRELLELLSSENVLVKSGNRYHWMAEAFPAESISLRSAAIDNFVIIEEGPKPRVIGEVDRPSAPLLIHDEAIYMHGGVQYHVDRLDWKEKKAYVKKVDVDYYTDANLAVDLEVLQSFDRAAAKGSITEHGEVAVRCVATIFKKLKLETNENIGWGKINIPEESQHTTAYWFALDDDAAEGLSHAEVEQGLVGLSHLLRHIAPLFLLCDPRDLHEVAQVRSPFTQRPTIFIYENQPGGVGMARRLFQIHQRLIHAARALLKRCSCKTGCPGCVGPAIGGTETNKKAALTLLERLSNDTPAHATA
jgi:DEAD/DEAH box helicase domain-containing protein